MGKPPVRLCRRPQLTLGELAPFLPLGTMPVSFYTYKNLSSADVTRKLVSEKLTLLLGRRCPEAKAHSVQLLK